MNRIQMLIILAEKGNKPLKYPKFADNEDKNPQKEQSQCRDTWLF